MDDNAVKSHVSSFYPKKPVEATFSEMRVLARRRRHVPVLQDCCHSTRPRVVYGLKDIQGHTL